jgi:hypothetical protein
MCYNAECEERRTGGGVDLSSSGVESGRSLCRSGLEKWRVEGRGMELA